MTAEMRRATWAGLDGRLVVRDARPVRAGVIAPREPAPKRSEDAARVFLPMKIAPVEQR